MWHKRGVSEIQIDSKFPLPPEGLQGHNELEATEGRMILLVASQVVSFTPKYLEYTRKSSAEKAK